MNINHRFNPHKFYPDDEMTKKKYVFKNFAEHFSLVLFVSLVLEK